MEMFFVPEKWTGRCGEEWALILDHMTNGPRWAIDREAYRGYPPLSPSQTKPDLIAIKLTVVPMQQPQVPQVVGRDFLWIECKAAAHDIPFGWKNVLQEAATRLSTAHPT